MTGTPPPPSRAQRITHEATSWPGVCAAPHRFGGVEFRVGRREIGHLHGDHTADVPFPRRIRDELIAEGRADRHHWLPNSGWVTLRMAGEHDTERAVHLLRLSYERAIAAADRHAARVTPARD